MCFKHSFGARLRTAGPGAAWPVMVGDACKPMGCLENREHTFVYPTRHVLLFKTGPQRSVDHIIVRSLQISITWLKVGVRQAGDGAGTRWRSGSVSLMLTFWRWTRCYSRQDAGCLGSRAIVPSQFGPAGGDMGVCAYKCRPRSV